MNNRKLQKKIRQAFTNATPDLAENIAVASLFTDKPEAEKELPHSKPIRTPIQFRATAALVASILVVAMLIGLIPMINPFSEPNLPNSVTPSTEPAKPTEPPTSPTDETTGPPLKPTPMYAITEDNALNIALEHAGLTMHDLSDYLISGNFQLVFPYYEVVLYTGDYKYYYWIDASYGTVAQLERTYSGELTSVDINSSLTPNVAAVEFAKDDPLIKYKDPAFKSVTATPPCYTVRMGAREYHCKVEVSVTHGIVTNLHMINENFFIVIDDGINFQLTPILPHREPMIDFTPEQVKIWLAEGMTYSEIKLLIGEQNSNVSPTPIDEPWYVWNFNEGINHGMRLEIRFKHPGYEHIDDWYADMNVHTKPYPDNPDAFYYEDDGSYLSTWLHEMKAVAALIRNGDETIEVLFGEDWYFGQGTDEPDLDRPPENPINQMDAYDMALQHAGITNEDVEHGDISLTSSSGHSHYLIVINTADYQYTYQISDKYGVIISADRYLREPLNFKHDSILSGNALSKADAHEIVKNDPMYQDSLKFVSVEGPYTMTDVFGNSYPTYEVHFKDDGYGDPKYIFVVCQSHKLVERVIMYTDETIFYEDEPVVPDGRLGADRASSLAVDHLGVSVTDVYMLTCREVTDDPEMANHYDVTFYYENFKWHYKIGMYNPTILEIEQIPLDE